LVVGVGIILVVVGEVVVCSETACARFISGFCGAVGGAISIIFTFFFLFWLFRYN
jgi:hypothetical protein